MGARQWWLLPLWKRGWLLSRLRGYLQLWARSCSNVNFPAASGFLMLMQSLPLIAVGFPPGCPTAHPELLSLPAALPPPRLPTLSQAEDLHMNQPLQSLIIFFLSRLWPSTRAAMELVLASASLAARCHCPPASPSPSPSQQISQSESQMFCYLTEEIYTLLKCNKCFPPLLLPVGPTNDSGRASGGELHCTFFLTYNQRLGATAETVQITFLFH